MDIAKDVTRYTTTIQIPKWLAAQIKSAGMTYSGALVAGWEAIMERESIKEDLEASRAVAARYKQDFKDMRIKQLMTEERIAKLERGQ